MAQDLEKIAEKIYFEHPRINSKKQLIEIVADEFAAHGLPDDAMPDKKAVFDMVVDRANNPRVGEFLEINHQRKGTFFIQLTSVSDEWIDGVIVHGTANAIMEYNVKEKGESITCRRSLCFFYPVKPVMFQKENA